MDDELRRRIADIVAGADLESLTLRKVFDALQAGAGRDLTPLLLEIQQEIASVVQRTAAAAAAAEDSASGRDDDDDDDEPAIDDSDESAAESAPSRASTSTSKHSRSTDSQRSSSKSSKTSSKSKGMGSAASSSGSGGGGGFGTVHLSPRLSDFLGCAELPRSQVIKRVWDYIKEHGLQNPQDKRSIRCDATLQGVLGTAECTMFSINKFLAPHMKSAPVASGEQWDYTLPPPSQSSSASSSKPAKSKKAAKVKRERDSDDDDDGDGDSDYNGGAPRKKRASHGGGGGGGGGLTAPKRLSDALSELLGERYLSRLEVVKRLNMRLRELPQSKKNTRDRVCDDALQRVFGRKYLNSFSINKYLSNHILPDDRSSV